MDRNNPSKAARPSNGATISNNPCPRSTSTSNAQNLSSSTSTSVTTAIGPLRGSFMISRVRSRSPKPPSQASALSARPSRCSPPLSSTQAQSNKAVCSSNGLPSSKVFKPHSSTPNNSPTSG
ncbi:hypothetical protein D3C80_1437600 [compost metagenome]